MQTDEYLKLAAVEDQMWYFRALHGHASDQLARGLSPARPGGILDAGCGTGGFIKRVAADFPDRVFTGLDYSALACDLARRRCPGNRIEQGSVTELPFADAEFAAVVSLDVLVQIDDRARALAEFHRVLRPGGVLVVNAAAYRWLRSYHDDACQARHRYTRPELAGQVRAAGFEILTATYWNLIPLPLIVAKRKLFRGFSDTSDVKLYPAPVEAAMSGAMACERAWLRRVGPLPAGCSVLVAARKPDARGF